MLLSTGLMARGRLGSPDTLAALALAAEEAGLPRVWFGDHVVYPVEYESRYPSPSGKVNYNIASPQLDVIVAMTWACAVTSRVGVGTSIMVIGERQLVWLAKQVASLDHLSRGRLTLGIGPGWCTEEYEALGVSPERRGARTDEYVQAMKVLWTDEKPSFAGEFVSFDAIYCNPKPAQAGGPPIWVGGTSQVALERTARYGAGWVAGGTDGDELARKLAWIRSRAEELGRSDAAQIGMLAQGVWRPDRRDLSDLLRHLRDSGVTEVVVPVQGKDPQEARDFVLSIPDLLD
jgi:probable F420-dependent oxidoreductase